MPHALRRGEILEFYRPLSLLMGGRLSPVLAAMCSLGLAPALFADGSVCGSDNSLLLLAVLINQMLSVPFHALSRRCGGRHDLSCRHVTAERFIAPVARALSGIFAQALILVVN